MGGVPIYTFWEYPTLKSSILIKMKYKNLRCKNVTATQEHILTHKLTKKEKEFVRRSVLKIYKDFKNCFELLGKI